MSIESRLDEIESRNARVELDKAWETSLTRRGGIAGLTYVVIALYLIVINNSMPFINAFIPVAGFLLSTLVLRTLRKVWQRNK